MSPYRLKICLSNRMIGRSPLSAPDALPMATPRVRAGVLRSGAAIATVFQRADARHVNYVRVG
ncbi:hypothetical protein HYPSUDRAFT_38126 [Hypholoma sublateritium FD-334 SS-4]|uniref:Uncharacterized protein n=1 Tax=Hypholoma sublateritium (strain FD-334 SS-4) TaxID=945553 RepID=A0A0D2Q0W4_HYPSF|nr:hypothetical protein HYPSUDRAFT_38126 [Hypholoma sublateritium FD-334 SS-4]